MITETGRIVAIENDSLWVETIQRSTCQSCAAEKGCGQGLVARWGGHTSHLRVLLEGRDAANYALDDQDTIAVPEAIIANGSLLVYLLPLLTMLAATLSASMAAWSEGAIILCAALGLLAGGGAVRLLSRRLHNDRRVQPVLVDNWQPVQWQ